MKSMVALAGRGRLSVSITGPSGSQVPFLLLRPLGGSMELWGEFAATLAREVRVIAFDPRGVGQSSGLPFPCSTREMALDALALLDALQVPRAHVFGLSLGGMVASWMAIEAPARVESLVLASTLPQADAVSYRIWSRIVPLLRAISRNGAETEVALVRAVLSREFRRHHPERVRAIEDAIRETPTRRRTLFAFALAAVSHTAWPRLPQWTTRTLLLFGEHDPIVGKRSRDELARDLPGAVIEILPGAGHDLSLEKPVETAERILRFSTPGVSRGF